MRRCGGVAACHPQAADSALPAAPGQPGLALVAKWGQPGASAGRRPLTERRPGSVGPPDSPRARYYQMICCYQVALEPRLEPRLQQGFTVLRGQAARTSQH